MFVEGPNDDINTRVSTVGQKYSINFNSSKAKTKSCLSLHYNSENTYLFVNGKNKFRADKKM